MKSTNYRLYFIDAMRAWAILMMLQGHFVDGLLDHGFRDTTHLGFNIWQYFRGITAPVFFTASGFIFTYLLIKAPQKGSENPRVKKGIRRGLQLLFIGYLLRMNLFGILQGEIYDSFYLVDVLQCIGLSILGIIGIYLLTYHKKKFLFPSLLLGITFLLFIFEPYYKQLPYPYLPQAVANYFTKANGSVFTIFPWFGYASFGGFLAVVFTRYKNFRYLYPTAIAISAVMGLGLIFYSSSIFLKLARLTDVQLFSNIYYNNYLFMRLGDVMLVFALFMLFRRFMTHSTVLKIGQSTLSIYIIHFILLYGSFTGLGLYYFLDHSLTPSIVIPGAIAFMIICTYSALQFEKNKEYIKLNIAGSFMSLWTKMEPWQTFTIGLLKTSFFKVKPVFLKLFRLAKN